MGLSVHSRIPDGRCLCVSPLTLKGCFKRRKGVNVLFLRLKIAPLLCNGVGHPHKIFYFMIDSVQALGYDYIVKKIRFHERGYK